MLFRDERFGMFVHFGLYAQNGWHEQEMWRKRIPKAQYVHLAETFSPDPGCAEEWAAAAEEAGMQYLCFTVKHHDGFCLWDTKCTDYNIMHTPYGRDLLREVADACRRHGLLLELYYSQPDWNCPYAVNAGGDHQLPAPNEGDTPDEMRYRQYIRDQMRELLTGYGPVFAVFWDIPPKEQDPSINEYVRSLMPGILINDRGYDKGDYSTPERNVPDGAFPRKTEACQSVGAESWGYRKNEDYFTAAHLADSIDRVMTKGGNYLLNVGPDGKGHLSERAKDLLCRVGTFYQAAKESYIGCKTLSGTAFPMTYRGTTLYVHLPAGYPKSGVSLRPITAMPREAAVLGREDKLRLAVEYLPSDFRPGQTGMPAYLHVGDLPVEENGGFPLVIRLAFDRETDFLPKPETQDDGKRIL